ncbi:MAG: DUF3047 domain-containing protein [Candidatus Omnitrophica bacterium]|nr:DUF3047 domain-containing protein [Candidatus Omnitrophota bacterium]
MKMFFRVIFIIGLIFAMIGVAVYLLDRRIATVLERAPSENVDYIAAKHFTFTDQSSLRGWEEKLLARKKTNYTVTQFKGKNCIKAESDSSASGLITKLKLPYDENTFISWDWFVERFPDKKAPEVLNEKKEFDFAGQFYVIFYSRFFLKNKAIQYVWANNLPVGTYDRSPFIGNVKIYVLESGPADDWKHEERNLRKDFKLLFGEEPEEDVDAIGFMTDSDSTNSTAVTYYADPVLGVMDLSGEGKQPEKKREGSTFSNKFLSILSGKNRRHEK